VLFQLVCREVKKLGMIEKQGIQVLVSLLPFRIWFTWL